MPKQAAISTFKLPIELTLFIGREREMADIEQLLTASRLLTLVGPGGCGKTRLALHAANRLHVNFADGACWVALASLNNASLVPQAVAGALQLAEQPGSAVTERLVNYLLDKELIPILDNCEHLSAACAELAHTILQNAPNVRILATSRESLAVTGETLYPVLPLPLPPRHQLANIESFDAVRLFVEHARQVVPRFALTADNASTVGVICRRLDGIPLALELASARVNVLSLEQIAARLDDRFALLTAAPRDSQTHHRTLRAAMDWSFDLLSGQEQILFRRLAVFAGGWTLDAVEPVCADEYLARGQIAETVFSLANKSLIVAETLGSGLARYHFLETMREYALEKLNASGEATLLRNRFLDYLVRLTEQTAPKLRGPYQKLWLGWLEGEQDNFRLALEWSLENNRVELGMRLANALAFFWHTRGYLQEGQQWLERLLTQATPDVSMVVRAQSATYAAMFSGLVGDTVTRQTRAREAIALSEAAGEAGKSILAMALLAMSAGIRTSGNATLALELLAKSVQIFREMDDTPNLALALQLHGLAAIHQKDFTTARQSLTESLALATEIKDAERTAHLNNYLGDVARLEQDYARAQRAYETSLRLFREIDAPLDIAGVLHNLAYVHLHQHDVELAEKLFGESLAIQQSSSNIQGIAECLAGFAAIALECGWVDRAACLLAAASVYGRDIAAQWPAERTENDYYSSQVRAQLTPDQFERAESEGRLLSLEQAIEYAQTLPMRSSVAISNPAPDFGGLSAREREVAALIGQGKSNIAIADELVLSKRTVESHVANILSKLDFTTRAQIVRWAIGKGLVKPAE